MDDARTLARDWWPTAAGLVAGTLAFGAVAAAALLRQRDEASDVSAFVDSLAASFGPDAGRVLAGLADYLEPDPAQVVAWFAYASHRVPLELDAEAFGNTASRTVDVQSLSVWDGALAYAPPAALFAAAAVVVLAGVRRPARAWVPGLGVAAGYVAAALFALRFAGYERSLGIAEVTVAPDPVTVALHTAAYALVFGTGAALVVAFARRRLADRSVVADE